MKRIENSSSTAATEPFSVRHVEPLSVRVSNRKTPQRLLVSYTAFRSSNAGWSFAAKRMRRSMRNEARIDDSSGIDTGILGFMETASSPSYRITTKSGIVVSNDLPRSAPAIQLHEGALSKGDKPPKDLSVGESPIVSYPLVEGSLVCRVTRTDGQVSIVNTEASFDFVEPDPVPKKSKSKVETNSEEEPVKVRRGRGRRAVS
jgi:hypothetical protein